jgi:peptidoglycan/xylan/chitin deacetylase (PgdA/CDA1 family)
LRAVLTWHSLDESGSVISTAPSLFARQIDVLLERGVRVVPLHTLPFLPLDEHAVAITFDDGFVNFSTVAAPILASRVLPATVFVVTGLLGGTNTWDTAALPRKIPEMALMNRDQVREAFNAGFDIGGHSVTHRALTGLAPELLDAEVGECARSIEAITGVRPLSFAFPYGACDETSLDFVAERFPIACTTAFATLGSTTSPHALPRLDMFYFRSEGILNHWGTPLFTGYMKARQTGRRIRSVLSRG